MIWIESGLAWLPFMIQRLDNEYMMRSSECPGLKKLPGEYITDMFYTSQPMEIPRDMSLLEATFKCIKAESQLLYSSDYPHWDFDLPSTIYDCPSSRRRPSATSLAATRSSCSSSTSARASSPRWLK